MFIKIFMPCVNIFLRKYFKIFLNVYNILFI